MPAVPTVFTSLGDFSGFQLFGAAAQAVTATGTSVTLNAQIGRITTASLNTAAGATYTLTISNSFVTVGDMVFVEINNGSNTTGAPNITTAVVSTGQVVLAIQNIHATAALNGTLTISFWWIPFL